MGSSSLIPMKIFVMRATLCSYSGQSQNPNITPLSSNLPQSYEFPRLHSKIPKISPFKTQKVYPHPKVAEQEIFETKDQ